MAKKTLFDSPKNVFQKQINEIFAPKQGTEFDILLKMVSIILFQNPNSHSLMNLYKTFPLEDFFRIIELFDGQTIKFFTREELKEALILSLCYYYKEVEQKPWPEIHRLVPFEVSPISYGTKIKSLNSFLMNKLQDLAEELGDGEKKNDEPKN